MSDESGDALTPTLSQRERENRAASAPVLTHHSALITHYSLSRARRREAVAGILWSSPWLIGFLVFTLGPVLASLFLSFNDYTISGAPKWVGLANFAKALTGSDAL